MPSTLRMQRINERMREELSEMVVMEISDPRLSGITITDVRVDREFTYADIYVSALEGHERAPEILEGLNHANGFLRKMLADRVELRIFPRLRFHWDPTPEKADHIEKLLASLRSEEKPASVNPENVTPNDLPEASEDLKPDEK
jgi:ribosome-binding factor A